MIQKNNSALHPLKCILCGGATLTSPLINEVHKNLGNILFNLYGTSEAGFSVMATPVDLRYSPATIGRPLQGLKIKLLDSEDKEVMTGLAGRICVKSRWTIKAAGPGWIDTGDIGHKDENGYYFLSGRVDDMIVSGGENVYPAALENILSLHDKINSAAVIGIDDDEFGQRLKAFVVLSEGCHLDKDELFDWLSTRTARFQMPGQIQFVDDLIYTAMGKPDKKLLLATH